MKYRLFLSDFDGTLVRADGTISDANIEAISRFRRQGGIFAVVTGRMLCSIRPRLRELGLEEGLVAAYQGAVIADIASGEVIAEEGFSREAALKAVRVLEEMGMHIQIYLDDVLYCNMQDELLRIYEGICGVRGVVLKEPLSTLIARAEKPVTKVIAMLPPQEQNALIQSLESTLGEGYFITASSDWLVEVLPAGVNKARAVKMLSSHYHVPKEEIAAIGDQLNDLPMLLEAGGRFAVSNAREELKKSATVVPSVEEDGVKVALEYAMGERL